MNTKELTEKIARAAWEGEIDGWTTRMVADNFGVSVSRARRVLRNICDGKCTLFPFVYDPYFDGVEVRDGRFFVCGDNSDYAEGHGLQHYNWFYT